MDETRTARIQVTFTFDLPFSLGTPDYPSTLTAAEAARRLLVDPTLKGRVDTGVFPATCRAEIDAEWIDDPQEGGDA